MAELAPRVGRRLIEDDSHKRESKMQTMEAHIGKMETQLKHWGAKLDELVARAQAAGTEAKTDYRASIDTLKAKHQAARSRLDEVRAAGSDRWETVKAAMESACNEIEVAVNKLTS